MDESRSAQRYLEDLTPGGSEYFDNPKRCYEWAYGRIESAHRIALDAALERNRLWDENKRLTEQVRRLRHYGDGMAAAIRRGVRDGIRDCNEACEHPACGLLRAGKAWPPDPS